MSGQTSARFWAFTILGMVIFLGLYFWGYWIKGKKAALDCGVRSRSLAWFPLPPIREHQFILFTRRRLSRRPENQRSRSRILPLVLVIIAVETWSSIFPPYFWIPGVSIFTR